VTSSADLFPPRRPLFFPVVIATVFLTIIGMTAGYMLGERHRRSEPPVPSQTQTAGATTVTASTPTPTVSVDGPACPTPAQQAAAVYGTSDLRRIFMILTANKTTVWICEDPAGKFFYQSHTLLNGQDLPLQQNRNGLFLPGVTRHGDGFEVFDQKGNRFEISRQKFQIYFVNGEVQSNDVDKAEG
jgi:hypothetical protein